MPEHADLTAPNLHQPGAHAHSAADVTNMVGFGTSVSQLIIPDATSGQQIVTFDVAGNADWYSTDVTVDGTDLVLGTDGLYLITFTTGITSPGNSNDSPTARIFVGVGGLGAMLPIPVGIKQPGDLAHCEVRVWPLYVGRHLTLTLTNPAPQEACALGPVLFAATRVGPLPPGW